MNEIAMEADISKSLLFFYFKNKKEFFLFLMKTAEEITRKHLLESGCYEEPDIFEMMYKGLIAKAELMELYPDMSNFAIRAYYEDDEDVRKELNKIIKPYQNLNTNNSLPPLNADDYKDGIDLRVMYQNMYLASEGYLYRMRREGKIDIDKVVEDYRQFIEFWKELFLK